MTTYIFFIAAVFAIYLMGMYLFRIATYTPSKTDRIFRPVERLILGDSKRESMSWKRYFLSLLGINLFVSLVGFIILLAQPLWGGPSMSFSLALNTIVSFMTNTNLQHYAGELALSNPAQMLVITVQMFVSAATGIAAAFAFMRGITGSSLKMGDAFHDFIRIIVRVLVPISFVIALILVSQGVPQTLTTEVVAQTITGQTQTLHLGSVASLESIKHLGTNGGGFYGANGAMPFENPSSITNLVHMLSMVMIPGGLLVSFGLMVRNRKSKYYGKEATPLIGVSSIIFLLAFATLVLTEMKGVGMGMNWEGKEMRFGIIDSSLFTVVSTTFTTGAINNMHDSLTPIGGMIPLIMMMINAVFGGDGVGFMNLVMYVMLTVFICGLMIGRTPEYLGKKIESSEMKRVAMVIIIHPLLILGFTALAILMSQGNSGHHGFTQMLYEFTSSAANNGSGFEGLVDNTLFWNLTTAIVMFVGRFAPMFLQLNIAGLLLNKHDVSESVGTLKTSTLTFTIALFVIVIVFSALTFYPSLILGPIAEFLVMGGL